MNKRGISWLKIVIIIVILALLGSLIYFIFIRKPAEKKEGVVFTITKGVQRKGLDPAFEFLFGKNFAESINWVIGKKTTIGSMGSFFWHMWIGFWALIWILIGSTIVGLIRALFHWKSYWLRVFRKVRESAITYISLLIIYPTLMQISIINRFIELVTFYHFTNWFIHSLILAIYVGYLPEIIMGIIKYREYAKAQKAIFKTAAGAAAMRAAGTK